MKKRILIVCLAIANCLLLTAYSFSQTLTPKVIPACGGYFTGGSISLSWTMGEPLYKILQGGNIILTQGEQQPYNSTISTGVVSSPQCSGSMLTVSFTAAGTYNADNIFTAQLSNAAGSFTSHTNIGTLAGTTSGTISTTIPLTTPSGAGYRIRVVSSDPVVTGADNGSDITINSPATTRATLTQPSCLVATGTITITAPAGTGYTYSINGSAYQSDSSFTGVAAGTYYVTAKSSTGCVSSRDTAVINPVPAACTNCVAVTHSAFNNFNASSNAGTATTLWFNLHTKLSRSQLTANGDYLLFYGGTLSFNGILTSFGTSASLPNGEVIADNTVSSPATSFNASTNTWVTRVPLAYSSSDLFISGAAITSGTGFKLSGGNKSTVVKGKFISNKSISSSWFYGLACYQPTFTNGTAGSINADNGIPVKGHQTGTPNNQTAGLVQGGSGGGGSNYTGGYSSTDNFTACNMTGTCVAVDLTSAIISPAMLPSFEAKVFPNPTIGEFTLQAQSGTKQTIEIVVTDILGHIVYHTRGDAASSYRFGQQFGKGAYVVKIIHSAGIKVIKVIKL